VAYIIEPFHSRQFSNCVNRLQREGRVDALSFGQTSRCSDSLDHFARAARRKIGEFGKLFA
jgi:hypothetical protein